MKLARQPKLPSFVKKKPGLPRRQPAFKIRLKKAPHFQYICVGGPFSGKTVWLTSAGTLPFAVDGYKGFYDRNMEWRQVQ